MNTIQTVTAVIGGVLAAVVAFLGLVRPRWAAWRSNRHIRQRREVGVMYLLEGKPPSVDERGVADPGYPPITVTLANLTAQLPPNGGSSLADAIHRIEDTVRRNRQGIEAQLEHLVKQVVDARHVAGQAAMVTARAEDTHKRDHGQLVLLLEEMRDRIWERFAEQDSRFDEQRLRELTYVAMLHELGIDLELPPPPPLTEETQ